MVSSVRSPARDGGGCDSTRRPRTVAMRLDTEFRKLPIRFDAERLAWEVAQFTEDDWRCHPQGHPGNSALALIAAHGDPDDDAAHGPMRPTPHLRRCEY